MDSFASLIKTIDSTRSTNKRIDALVEFFDRSEEEDIVWTIALLSGKRPKLVVNTTMLREWATEAAGIPAWLFEETYHIVGDLAETISLLLDPTSPKNQKSLSEWLNELESVRELDENEKKQFILRAWGSLDLTGRFAFNKLITGGFRIGVSQKNLVKALSKFTGKDVNELSYRLMGNWSPLSTTYTELIREEVDADRSRPYPFYLAYAVEEEVEDLGDIRDWIIERKWDGIRGQLIKRSNEIYVWSRGEELMTERFPELVSAGSHLPDGVVLDGEIVAFNDDGIMPFQDLQKRIGRKKVGAKILKDAPVRFIAYDILEYDGKDIRELSMLERRKMLEKVLSEVGSSGILLSEVLELKDWDEAREERSHSREYLAEGLMLKRKDSEYGVGRKKGEWWKWKIDALTIDAVMIYAMRGHGRRANLYTDYTFAIWKGDELIPFTKAYSGLTDAEFRRVDRFVKQNTLERFGPVRSVKPELVFEIAFEGIARSKRHKSGISLRFPRMHRWREDKPASEANTLEDLEKMLDLYNGEKVD